MPVGFKYRGVSKLLDVKGLANSGIIFRLRAGIRFAGDLKVVFKSESIRGLCSVTLVFFGEYLLLVTIFCESIAGLKGDGALRRGLWGKFIGNMLTGDFSKGLDLCTFFIGYVLGEVSGSFSGSDSSDSYFEKYLSLKTPEGTNGLFSRSSFKIPYFCELRDSLDE
jgi:hypothetical protein